MLIRKTSLKEIGRFNDQFIFYDDVDWSLRARELGYSLWAVSDSVIRHNFSGLQPKVPWREYYRKRNRAYCLAKHPPARLGRVILWIYICYLHYLRGCPKLPGDRSLTTAYNLALKDFLGDIRGKNTQVHELQAVEESETSDGNSTGIMAKLGSAVTRFTLLIIAVARGTVAYFGVARSSGITETRYLAFEISSQPLDSIG